LAIPILNVAVVQVYYCMYYAEAGNVVVRTRSLGEAATQKIQKMVRGLKRKWNGELT